MMKILCLISLLTFPAQATSYAPLEFPDAPSPASVLKANKLKDADETALLQFVESHWDSAGFWLPDVSAKETESISDDYFRRIESRDKNAQTLLTMAVAKLQEDRLRDPRRIVDAVLRELGQRGAGRFDLDDGGTGAKSRFLTPTGYLSE
jgi:hypothetical protein